MSDRPGAAAHPEIWALVALLDAADGPLVFEGVDPAAVAIGASGGAGLLTVAFRDARSGRSTLHLTGWNPFQTTLLGGLERLGARAVVRESGRKRRAGRHLDEALAGGGPVAVWVDGATLGLAADELRGVSPTVVVAQLSEAHDAIVVSDGRTGRTVDRATLEAARHASPAHRTRVVTLEPGPLDEPAVIARRGLAAAAVGPIGGPPGASGAAGLRAFAELAGASADWAEVFPDAGAVAGALDAFRTAISAEDGLLRRHQAAFVDYAASVAELPAVAELSGTYRALASDWDAVAELADATDLPALAARLSTLADAEERTLAALRAALRPA